VPGFGIAGASLPAAAIGSAYSTTLLAIGAVGTPSWHISSGSLPTGLNLASNGVISGTPAANATSGSFGVTLSDSTGRTVTKAFTLAVTRVTLPTCGLKGCPV
jgi:large repetitive protein